MGLEEVLTGADIWDQRRYCQRRIQEFIREERIFFAKK